MRKRIIRSLTATVLITSIMGMTVLADEVTDIKNQQNSLAQEKQNVEDELAFLLTQMDELELSMAQKNDEIEQANKDLASAQQKFNSQQDDMNQTAMTCDVVAVCFFHPSERRDSGAEAGRGVPAPVLRPLKRRVLSDIKNEFI